MNTFIYFYLINCLKLFSLSFQRNYVKNYSIKILKIIKDNLLLRLSFSPYFSQLNLSIHQFINPSDSPSPTGRGEKFRPDTMKNDIHLAHRAYPSLSAMRGRFDVNYTRSIACSRASSTINQVEGPRLIHFALAIERNTRCNYRKLSRSTAWTRRRPIPTKRACNSVWVVELTRCVIRLARCQLHASPVDAVRRMRRVQPVQHAEESRIRSKQIGCMLAPGMRGWGEEKWYPCASFFSDSFERFLCVDERDKKFLGFLVIVN